MNSYDDYTGSNKVKRSRDRTIMLVLTAFAKHNDHRTGVNSAAILCKSSPPPSYGANLIITFVMPNISYNKHNRNHMIWPLFAKSSYYIIIRARTHISISWLSLYWSIVLRTQSNKLMALSNCNMILLYNAAPRWIHMMNMLASIRLNARVIEQYCGCSLRSLNIIAIAWVGICGNIVQIISRPLLWCYFDYNHYNRDYIKSYNKHIRDYTNWPRFAKSAYFIIIRGCAHISISWLSLYRSNLLPTYSNKFMALCNCNIIVW